MLERCALPADVLQSEESLEKYWFSAALSLGFALNALGYLVPVPPGQNLCDRSERQTEFFCVSFLVRQSFRLQALAGRICYQVACFPS